MLTTYAQKYMDEANKIQQLLREKPQEGEKYMAKSAKEHLQKMLLA